MKRTVLLFTSSYPYLQTGENVFLKNELEYLLKSFNLIIIPRMLKGGRIEVDKRIKIDESLSIILDKQQTIINRLLNGIHLNLLIKEIKLKPKLLFYPKHLIKLLLFIDTMKRTQKWFAKTKYWCYEDLIIYTYWFTPITSSFLFYSNKKNVITRVHGGDLYEERHNDYLPLRSLSIKKITTIYCVSQAGVNYLNNKYPAYSHKFKLARLGTNRNFENEKIIFKEKHKLRIVSCSGLIPLKRVNLILRAIELWINVHNDIETEWIHFGGGPLFKEILKESEKIQNPKLTIDLKGHVNNDEILEYYQNKFVDIFITTSSTEGGVPLSLQEAQSFGIPCIGTNVGGIPEIINEKTGVLISENPSPHEIAEAIGEIYNKDEKEIEQMRLNCYENWREKFNANINFSKFVEEIRHYE